MLRSPCVHAAQLSIQGAAGTLHLEGQGELVSRLTIQIGFRFRELCNNSSKHSHFKSYFLSPPDPPSMLSGFGMKQIGWLSENTLGLRVVDLGLNV